MYVSNITILKNIPALIYILRPQLVRVKVILTNYIFEVLILYLRILILCYFVLLLHYI